MVDAQGSVSGQSGPQRVRKRPGRVPVSCAECRRLKVRCDRKVPCESCIKRGCAAVCPDGSLVVGKHNRLILANTEELHEEIDTLRARVRQLEKEKEQALAQGSGLSPISGPSEGTANASSPQSQGTASSDTLTPGESSRKDPDDSDECRESDGLEENLIDAFGTLRIGLEGETKYLGHTARPELLIRVPDGPPDERLIFPHLTRELLEASVSMHEAYWPSTAIQDNVKRQVLELLPPLSEAVRLCHVFLEHGQYLYTPIPRQELFEDVLGVVYSPESPDAIEHPDALAMLFMVFAFATFLDPAQRDFTPEADEYTLLSRIASNMVCPLHNVSVMWIQALAYFVQFVDLRDIQGTSRAWLDIGQAVKYGQSIGLQLRSTRWKLEPEAGRRRSRLFWQLFMADTWLSFGFGRPPSISLAYVECELPPDYDEVTNPDGTKEMGFHMWTIQFAIFVRSQVMRVAFVARMPPYPTVLDLDRRIREFPVPQHLRRPMYEMEGHVVTLQRWITLASKECILLHLHRGFFAQALQERPDDPLKHKYGVSVMAAYRSAYRLMNSLACSYPYAVTTFWRYHLPWSYAISSSIVMCLLVTRAKPLSITRSALAELDSVLNIFEQAAPNSTLASMGLDTMRKLHRQAHEAADFGGQSTLALSELERLGGKTHFIAKANKPVVVRANDDQVRPSSPPRLSPRTVSGPKVPQQQQQRGWDEVTFPENVHPAIVQDMNQLISLDSMGDTEQYQIPMFDIPDTSTSYPFMPTNYDATVDYGDATFGMPPHGFLQPSQMSTQATSYGQEHSPVAMDSAWETFVDELGLSGDHNHMRSGPQYNTNMDFSSTTA